MGWLGNLFGGRSDEALSGLSRALSCSRCGNRLEQYSGGFGGMTGQYGGVKCPRCQKIWCDGCHPPSKGQKCPECGGQLECVFGRL